MKSTGMKSIGMKSIGTKSTGMKSTGMKSAIAVAALAALVLSGCTGEQPPQQPADDATASTPPLDQPAEDIPPATAPGTPTSDAAPSGAPGAATPDGDRDLARFDGYGDIRFGTDAAAMEQAWGGELNTLGKEGNESCYFMTPKWVKVPAEFNFMIGDGKFARFGTESDKFVAPGGGKVGMSKAEIAGLYPGRTEEQPHKYTEGLYLRVRDDAGGKGVLVFETDGKADAAKVTEWRVGVPPQVDYVEGCS